MILGWYFATYHWLEGAGLYRDILASAIGLTAARMIAARPLKGVKASQARQEDLLDTSTPGGLAEVHEELKKLRKLLGDIPDNPIDDPDETPDTDDHDGTEEPPERKEEPKWISWYKRSRKGHVDHAAERGERGPEHVIEREPPSFRMPPGGHR